MRAAFSSTFRAFAARPSALPVAPLALAPAPAFAMSKRFASHKQGGKSRNGRDSNPKYRGWKRGHFEAVGVGEIILRQKGSLWHPGEGVGMGRDFTIYATKPGFIYLTRIPWKLHGGNGAKMTERKLVNIVDIRPANAEQDIR